jgi:hypothetical protein
VRLAHGVKNLVYIGVRKFAQRVQRFARTSTVFKLLPDSLPFGLGQRAKYRQGRRGTLRHLLGLDARTEAGAGGSGHLI